MLFSPDPLGERLALKAGLHGTRRTPRNCMEGTSPRRSTFDKFTRPFWKTGCPSMLLTRWVDSFRRSISSISAAPDEAAYVS
jgi:hypothetical protein